MPVPLLAYGLAAGGGMATGYVIDHLVGDSKYTAEEAVLDVALGVTGGSLVKPALRIGGRAKTSLRVSRGRPSTFDRLAYRAQSDPVMWGSKMDQAAYIAMRTGRASKGDVKRISKFVAISGSHSAYLASRGSGAPSRASLTRTKTPRRRPRPRRQGRASAESGKYGGPRKSSMRGGRARRSGQSCPPGHYWSKRFKKCVRYRKY